MERFFVVLIKTTVWLIDVVLMLVLQFFLVHRVISINIIFDEVQ